MTATGTEIERKWLVTRLPDGFEEAPHLPIRQGYLAVVDGGPEVRIRDIAGECWLTVKGPGHLIRTEVELEMPRAKFDQLWPLTDGRRVEKTRTRLPIGSLVADLDVYGGPLEPLRILEIEFPSEDAAAAFEPPEWVGAEVTADGRYKNRSLAGAAGPPQ